MKFMKRKLLCIAVALIGSTASFAGMVNVNQADSSTLAHHLKGIGVKKAEAIIAYREEYGAFSDIEDLVNVKGIGEGLLEKNLKDLSLTKGAVAMIDGDDLPKVVEKVKKKPIKDPVVISKARTKKNPSLADEQKVGVKVATQTKDKKGEIMIAPPK